MAPHTPLSTTEVGEKARRELLQLLESVRGKKNLVIEKSLAGPLGLFVKFSTLQEYGVDRVFFLENANADASLRNVVFLARGEKPHVVTAVAEQIKKLRQNSQVDHEFNVIWVPRRTLISDQLLEEAGVLGEVNVHEYPLFFMPLADDLLSLELDDAFGDLYLRKDPTPIFLSAKALMLMQQKHGLFPRIIGKGDNAKRLADLLIRMRSELTAGEQTDGSGSTLDLAPSQSIESLIIIDREVDFPTVLLTQLTYEGLIDEFFGISSNHAEIDATIVGPAPTSSAAPSSSTTPSSLKRKIPLDGTDTLYTTLRDANCAVVGPLLNKTARRLQSTLESRTTAKTTADLRAFVSRLPGYQSEQASLKLHTNLAEDIIKRTSTDAFTRTLEVQQNIAAGADPGAQHQTVEDLMAQGTPLPTILRLLAVNSTFSNGLRPRDFDAFRRSVLLAYGHQHLLTLSALEKMGLITARQGGGLVGVGGPVPTGKVTNYTSARKALHLIVDEVNESEPDDVAYVFSGYAPLSVRLVQCVVQKGYMGSLGARRSGAGHAVGSAGTGWRGFEEVVKLVRGATVEEVQAGEEKAVKARQMLNGSGGEGGRTVVVFFLGGVCRAEIAALRFVAKGLAEEGRGRRLLVCTTGVVTGDGVVGAAVEGRSFAE
ncbi:putative vacuolar sorting protein [Trichodelitschia bisporula]|uniref:Putative vacuolar sorting protein n=1 Tax=Trichodelitschia bisporula TaxID=703511 RepID=A0A6G1I757_9PEZI|nr:putative vacuolar sorting protein [Trichodelitschia bisporula]